MGTGVGCPTVGTIVGVSRTGTGVSVGVAVLGNWAVAVASGARVCVGLSATVEVAEGTGALVTTSVGVSAGNATCSVAVTIAVGWSNPVVAVAARIEGTAVTVPILQGVISGSLVTTEGT